MTAKWTEQLLNELVENYRQLTDLQKAEIAASLDQKFAYETYKEHNQLRLNALENSKQNKNILLGAEQIFPETVNSETVDASTKDIFGYAIVLTAGGEGERLRLSLADLGYTNKQLANFTKATFPLPGLPEDFGALQTNLCLIATICNQYKLDIPVVITTGPKGSTTAEYIPLILKKYNNFGVKQLRVICQSERLHLTNDGKIVADTRVSPVQPLTNPDETGGPLMQLRMPTMEGNSCLDWFIEKSCTKILVLQATALYNPAMLFTMAAAGKDYDGLGVGIERTAFPENDPYGTFVEIKKGDSKQLIIVEKDIRNQATYQLTDASGENYLPFNTGFYVFDLQLLKNGFLPDYATPPKEQLPGMTKSPKIGYAATEILTLAKSPAVLTVPASWFAVIKNADDLNTLSELAKYCGLNAMVTQSLTGL